MEHKQQLLERIANREAQIGIVGLGYVGLPLAVAFAQEGFSVVGVDLDSRKIARVQRGGSYGEDVPPLAEHFFRKCNLMAQRVLALRRTADLVEDDVQTYRIA